MRYRPNCEEQARRATVPQRDVDQWGEGLARLREAGRDLRLMEVCGTHTVSLFRSGVRALLPPDVRLISGPGCPVCVTAQGYIDAACYLAGRSGLRICTYGDMIRVPGRNGSLAEKRAEGADVMVVYSPVDALQQALKHPEIEVVFLAVGFETTTPGTAAVLKQAEALGVSNFSALCAHKTVIPAMHALLSDPGHCVDGFLCPGHVSVIIGAGAYAGLVKEFGPPCVIAGFEPRQMVDGIRRLIHYVSRGEAAVENVYGAAVTEAGNRIAWGFVEDVFEVSDAVWRAMGVIPGSGLALRPKYADFDAARRYGVEVDEDYEPEGCCCGAVIQGKLLPPDCPLFGRACTPRSPVGPCMVSSEGSCAAYHRFGG
ncbi:MAG: hydrogenase formation protein HypD [Lentisphaerae bacterium]|nr:hydrogenase formation protein HypD [Lentisphaerota bacterium]MBT4819575.1 hydrogenase formation protein HypD [Lentisphaerota bacterium]MBT7055263.1 hydrogenase formation protein HypD [Lentisphaerota bacterium]MBT7841389.1 hydrogenase formation protein HypD [Lentisphaerota bacterium]